MEIINDTTEIFFFFKFPLRRASIPGRSIARDNCEYILSKQHVGGRQSFFDEKIIDATRRITRDTTE